MRTIAKGRDFFYGTHKGYEIEIERIRPPVESFGGRHFYIRVFNDYGHAYDGYSPADVTTLAEAKREALYGACLKARPDSSCKSNGERLCEAFAETFSGGGWADAPAWDDFDASQQDRWNRTAEIFMLDLAVQMDAVLEAPQSSAPETEATCDLERELLGHLRFAVKLLKPWAGGTAKVEAMEAVIAKAEGRRP